LSIIDPIKFDLPDELRMLGLSDVVISGKNLLIEYNQKRVICTFSEDDWHKTKRSIEKTLRTESIDPKVATCLIPWLGREYLKLISPAPKIDGPVIKFDKTTLRKARAEISREKWTEKLAENYRKLFDVTMKNLPDVWVPLEFALSVKTILNIEGCTLPFGGILLGVPGSSKTVVIELFRGLPHTFYSDSFTPKSFVSHNSAVKKEKLKDIDMLPKIKDKFFLAPELAPIFSSEDKELIQLLGILTRVLDGRGFESDSGAQGHRACNGDYMFTMLGAAVDIPHKVYKHLSALGPKLYFLRLPKVEHNEEYYLNNMKENFQDKIKEIRAALHEYIAVFEMNPDIISSGEENEPSKIPMRFDNNEELACRHIVQLAQLLGPLRAAVPTWRTEDTQGSSYAYAIPNIEEPGRAITILQNLAAGHALSQGRDHITIYDIPIIIQIVLSTASLERSKIFDLLISNAGYLRTQDVVQLLNTTPPTARRAMTELKAVGLVSLEEDVIMEDESNYGNNRSGLQMTLKREFDWFLTDEFLRLRRGDTRAIDCEQRSNEDEKEKSPGRCSIQEDEKENPPPRSAINNLQYDIIIHKTIFQRGILSC
jgi:hypothetical protein